MSLSRKSAHLARALDAHFETIQQTFQMLENPAPSTLDKVDWSDVITLGDQISKQATVAGMLWNDRTPDVKEVEENLEEYCNLLQGFILLCHGSTVGIGPTLHANIRASAKQVTDVSFALLKAVASCGPSTSVNKLAIPQLSGSVWEACSALKKTPTTNYTAIGRAVARVAVSLKDVLREMKELKPVPRADSADVTSDRTAEAADESKDECNSSESDLDDDLSVEEMKIVQLVIGVASDALLVTKEVIRFLTGLSKNSDRELTARGYIDALERLRILCQDIGEQVNELGASVYPPQEFPLMKSAVKKMYHAIADIKGQVEGLDASPETLLSASEGLISSLRKLESELSSNLVAEMDSLAL